MRVELVLKRRERCKLLEEVNSGIHILCVLDWLKVDLEACVAHFAISYLGYPR